jgi:ring-1,2-phenylacetyl-CoA epoxidase subunit PaaD
MLRDDDFTRLLEAVGQVEDPEVPVTLKDLGVLQSVTQSEQGVHVLLRATKIGCPGKTRMVKDIETVCANISAGIQVNVEWDLSPWKPDDVSEMGRIALRDFGIVLNAPAEIKCPYCSSRNTEMLSDYGGSICKAPFRCGSCGSMFDRLRSVENVQIVSVVKKSLKKVD